MLELSFLFIYCFPLVQADDPQVFQGYNVTLPYENDIDFFFF